MVRLLDVQNSMGVAGGWGLARKKDNAERQRTWRIGGTLGPLADVLAAFAEMARLGRRAYRWGTRRRCGRSEVWSLDGSAGGFVPVINWQETQRVR
jgi:hypothetical protein